MKTISFLLHGGVLLVTAAMAVGCPAKPAVLSFSINNGATTTPSRTVKLNNTSAGDPGRYMASESSSFTRASWQTYSTGPRFTLSSGNGTKTVYFKVKNSLGESAVSSDTITLDTIVGGTEQTVMLPGSVPLVMVWVPEGTYSMGRYSGEEDSFAFEDPQHFVTVVGFWMAKYELTKRQWQAVMGTPPWSGESYVLDDLDSPAVYVSWNDAKAFLAAANSWTGLTFELPSEAAWEYACRAGTATRFYWGDDLAYTAIDDYAWWSHNAWDADERYAHVVGQKLPNAFGLYDMSGNVWEWCEDDYTNDYTGSPTDGSAWAYSPRGLSRDTRGGSWGDIPEHCRSAYRNRDAPVQRSPGHGFRVVRTP